MEVQVMLLRRISAFMPALFEAHKMCILLGGRVCWVSHISHHSMDFHGEVCNKRCTANFLVLLIFPSSPHPLPST
jgi:hypothetical protein